jgi:hypothetical protein
MSYTIRKSTGAAVLLFLFLGMSQLQAGTEAAAVLETASLLGPAQKAVYEVDMEIVSSRGSKSRQLTIYKEAERDSFYRLLAHITAPAFLSDMKLLILQEEGDEYRWLKTSRGVRSIAASGRKEQIFDSDLDTEDLADIGSGLYTLTLLSSGGISSTIRAVEDATGYSRIITIDNETKLITRIEYHDRQQHLYKSYELLKTMRIGTTAFPELGKLSHPDEGTYTMLMLSSVELPDSIPPRVFNRHQM